MLLSAYLLASRLEPCPGGGGRDGSLCAIAPSNAIWIAIFLMALVILVATVVSTGIPRPGHRRSPHRSSRR